MMPWVHRMLKQKAVLWAHTGTSDRQGQPLVSSPVEIRAYYETILTVQQDGYSQTTGKEFIVWVDRAIALGSMLWLGKLDDVPSPVTDAYRVVGYSEVHGRSIGKPERYVTLNRYTGSLPTVSS